MGDSRVSLLYACLQMTIKAIVSVNFGGLQIEFSEHGLVKMFGGCSRLGDSGQRTEPLSHRKHGEQGSLHVVPQPAAGPALSRGRLGTLRP